MNALHAARPSRIAVRIPAGSPRIARRRTVAALGRPGSEGVDELLDIYIGEIRKGRFLSREEEHFHGREVREARARLAGLVLATRAAQEEAVVLLSRVRSREIEIEDVIDACFAEKGSRKAFRARLEEETEFLAGNLARSISMAERARKEPGNRVLRAALDRRVGMAAEVLVRLGIKGCHLNRWVRANGDIARGMRIGLPPASEPFETAAAFLARAEEIEAQFRRYEAAKAALARGNLWLVISIARRHLNRGLPLLDLIGEGNVGLMRATEKFDPAKGTKFSTYATWWIIQSIRRAIGDKSRMVRLPSNAVEALGKMSQQRARLTEAEGEEPSLREAGRSLGLLTEDEIGVILQAAAPVRSLDAARGEEGECALRDILEAPASGDGDPAESGEGLRSCLDSVISELKPREQAVLRLRFGLGGEGTLTLAEVAEKLGLSKERIRQVEIGALEKLRRPSRISRMEPYRG